MSGLTTYFGPKLSLRTTNANQSGIMMHVPSTGTLQVDGPAVVAGQLTTNGYVTATGEIISTGTVNLAAARLLSRQTTVSGTTLVLRDGEIAVTNVSATSATLQFRSGVTVYTFRADAAAVL